MKKLVLGILRFDCKTDRYIVPLLLILLSSLNVTVHDTTQEIHLIRNVVECYHLKSVTPNHHMGSMSGRLDCSLGYEEL